MTPEQLAGTWREYAADRSRIDLRNALAEHYFPLLVRPKAATLWKRLPPQGGVQRVDLEQRGAMGLLRAVERFEPARKLQFMTFAHHHIRGAMLDELRDQDWAPRLARQLKETPPRILSLSRSVGPRDWSKDCTAGELLADPHNGRAARSIDLADEVQWLLSVLSSRDRRIAEMLWMEGRSQDAAAGAVGLSPARISQMLPGILQALREHRPLHNRPRGRPPSGLPVSQSTALPIPGDAMPPTEAPRSTLLAEPSTLRRINLTEALGALKSATPEEFAREIRILESEIAEIKRTSRRDIATKRGQVAQLRRMGGVGGGKKWDPQELSPVAAAVAECLAKKKKPANLREIMAAVGQTPQAVSRALKQNPGHFRLDEQSRRWSLVATENGAAS